LFFEVIDLVTFIRYSEHKRVQREELEEDCDG